MRFQLSFDEIINGVQVKAGTIVTATLTNVDQIVALALMDRGNVLSDDVAPLSFDLGLAWLDIAARRALDPISLSAGVVTMSPAGTPVLTILTRLVGDITLTNDAGGKFVLQGRTIATTNKPLTPGTVETIGVQVGTTGQVFTIGVSPAFAAATPNPAPVPVPTPLPDSGFKMFGIIGQNLASEQIGYSSTGYPFLNRAKSSSPWQCGGGDATPVPVTPFGFPTAVPPNASGRIETIINVEGPWGPADKQRWVLETTKTDWTIAVAQSTNVARSVVNGVQRIEFEVHSPFVFPPTQGYGAYLTVTAAPTPFVDEVDRWSIFRLDEEAEFRTGRIFRQQFVDRMAPLGVLRTMDWFATNHSPFTELSQTRQLGHYTWAADGVHDAQVPLAALVELANVSDVPPWFNVPHGASDAMVTAMVSYIETHLTAHLPYVLELSNEAWNTGPGFHEQWQHFYELMSPQIDGPGDNASHGYGWRSAQVMALAHRVSGYSGRLRAFLGTKNYDTTQSRGALAGIAHAIAEWGDASSPRHDADFAARFPEAGAIYSYFGGATYIGGGIGYGLSQQDTATLQSWADATDDTGLANLFHQLRYGGLLSSNDPLSYLTRLAGDWAGQKAIADEMQVAMVFYEGCAGFEGAPGGTIGAFLVRAILDDRMRTFSKDWIAADLAAGFFFGANLCDIGSGTDGGGVYGSLHDAYHLTAPRHLGLVEANAAARPAATPMVITATADRPLKVGVNAVVRLSVSGGYGQPKLTVTGMAPGQNFDGFRTVRGALTMTGSTDMVVVATDESGATATLTVTQAVGAAPVGKRYLKLAINALSREPSVPPSDNPLLSEIRFRDDSGAYVSSSSITPSGDADGRLLDGNAANQWAGPRGQINSLIFDFAGMGVIKPSAIEMYDIPGNPGQSPGDFEWFWSDDAVVWQSIYRTKVRGGTAPGNAVYNPSAYFGAYENDVFNVVPVYP